MLGRPDLAVDPRFSTIAARVRHRAELRSVLEDALGRHDAASWLERLDAAGIPAAPILTYDRVSADPQTIARRMVLEADGGATPLVGNPIKMSATPWRLRKRAPALGEDTGAVLQRVGFAPTDIERLRSAGVLERRTKPDAEDRDRRPT
jgi:formyl-CoA transferase